MVVVAVPVFNVLPPVDAKAVSELAVASCTPAIKLPEGVAEVPGELFTLTVTVAGCV